VVICRAMQTIDFDYHLPEVLIAQYPLTERTASRLLHLNKNGCVDRQFTDLLDLIEPNDLLVFNNTQVIPARLHGFKSSGGKVEVLIERVLDEHRVLAHVRASKSPKAGSHLRLEFAIDVKMLNRQGELFELDFDHARPVLEWLQDYGHMPLPPYIERNDEDSDQQRYQTVYAKHPGAVAAPTAGLHFDQPMLDQLSQKGVDFAHVTLHVGAGTFQPVRVENILDHHMHAEMVDVPEQVVAQVAVTKARGGRVIAVGTTAVRSLESAARQGQLAAMQGDTDIFIYPGYQFKVVDALITNFHLPQSTLLMLVSALAGHQNIMQAYQHAVQQQYRLFSYGDAMLIESESLT